ncbi:MAG: QacE family quaternary ammonium compound efflux SMR transporter [Methyloprofundus sp.]|nr:QacE family quaternary ammonium compound efflux SMR transporter [Methyloprofundus sp.]
MGWVYLIGASIAEIFFALSLKYNEGFTKLIPSIVTAVAGAGSFGLLILAIKTLPLGTAYAIWTGVGAAGIAVAGIFLFKESVDIYRLASIALIILGVIGLKLTSTE